MHFVSQYSYIVSLLKISFTCDTGYWYHWSHLCSFYRISIRDLLIECFHQRISQLSTWTQEIMIHGELPMQYFTLCWQWGVEREFKAWTISPPCHQISMQALHIAISPSPPYRYTTKPSISLYHQALHTTISPSTLYHCILVFGVCTDVVSL